ncbi:hypothetical protein ODW14_12095, partial [Escherichia coli]|nr:hypothetical protein [Escherichia coli]
GGTADRNRSHWSTSKTPSYTKSVSWQHHHFIDEINVTAMNFNDSAFCILLILINEFEFMMK